MTFSGVIPMSSKQWATVAGIIGGGLLGWLVNPIIWVVVGPFRWVSMLLASSAVESLYGQEDNGDDGTSVGPLQWNDGTWPTVTSRPLTDRSSAFWSAYYAGEYLENGLMSSWRWWLIAVPFWGFGAFRWLWTGGPSAGRASTGSFSNVLELMQKQRNIPAALFWRGLTLLPALWVIDKLRSLYTKTSRRRP